MSLPSGITCTPLEYARSLRDPSIYCLTRGDSFGLIIVAFAALLSVIALLYVFRVILWTMIVRLRTSSTTSTPPGGLQAFYVPMELLVLSLFLADTLQAIGGILNLKWIYDGKVVVGSFCNAQGIFQNIGETGVALNTLVIAAYTFIGIRFQSMSMKTTLSVLFVIWVFIPTIVALGNIINRGRSSYISPTPFWCWISSDYLLWRILAEYIWLWSALAFSIFIYPFMVIHMWRTGVHLNTPAGRALRRHQSLAMLAYPAVYCILVLPLSIARWVAFGQEAKRVVNSVPSAATFAVAAVFQLSGLLNVVLLVTTRPTLFQRSRPIALPPSTPDLGDIPLPDVSAP